MAVNFRVVEDRLSPNFRLSEFANSRDRNSVLINQEFLEFARLLQVFRNWYNRPINITSGFRTPEFNRAIGGASNSAHLRGLAVDFRLPTEWGSFTRERQNEFLNNVRRRWEEICRQNGRFAGVIFYDTFVHIGFWHVPLFQDRRTRR